jgi:uncharacterized protein (TIGR00251 family)
MARLRVRVTPGARQEEIVGWHGGSLRVRVRARPQKGRANQAVLRLLARRLGVAPVNLSIVSGAASRDKLVEVDGLSEEEVRGRLNDSHWHIVR